MIKVYATAANIYLTCNVGYQWHVFKYFVFLYTSARKHATNCFALSASAEKYAKLNGKHSRAHKIAEKFPLKRAIAIFFFFFCCPSVRPSNSISAILIIYLFIWQNTAHMYWGALKIGLKAIALWVGMPIWCDFPRGLINSSVPKCSQNGFVRMWGLAGTFGPQNHYASPRMASQCQMAGKTFRCAGVADIFSAACRPKTSAIEIEFDTN